jgi:tRNA(Arg) A34 adenosine deaminase TadA
MQCPFELITPTLPSALPPFEDRCQVWTAVGVADATHLHGFLRALEGLLPLPRHASHVRRVKALDGARAELHCLVLLCEMKDLPGACGLPLSLATAQANVRAALPGSAVHRLCAALGGLPPSELHAEAVRVVMQPQRERALFDEEAMRCDWPLTFRRLAAGAPPPPPPLAEAEVAYFRAGLRLAAERAEAGAHAGFAPAGAVLALPGAGGAFAVRGAGFSREAPAHPGGGAPPAGLAPLRSAVMEAVAATAAADARASSAAAAAAQAARAGRRADAPEERAAHAGCKRARCEPPPGQYLSTGCDAFLTQEPNLMDAMALVHSRVNRVIYRARQPAGEGACEGWGASRTRIHGVAALNHRFSAVYRENAEWAPAGE